MSKPWWFLCKVLLAILGATPRFNKWLSARFTDQGLPLLRERGLFRSEYSHSTLRGHLGLPVPVNRHTAARSEAA